MLTGALAFVTSPVGRYAAIAVAVIGLVAWQRTDAANAERLRAEAEFTARLSEALEAEKARQTAAAQDVLRAAAARANAAEQRAATLQEVTDDLTAQVKASGAGCDIPPDIADRLRAIK